MESLYKKLSIVAIAMFAAVSVFGEAAATETKASPGFNQGYGICESQMMGAYNAPARIDVCGSWDVTAYGSFIYWQPREKGLELGYVYNEANIENLFANFSNMDWEFKPGFKVGLGTAFDHDNWLINADYTRLTSDLHKHTIFTTPDESFYSPWTGKLEFEIPIDVGVKSHWDLEFNLLDVKLSRPCYVGTQLIFKPYAAVRAYWIEQTYKQVVFSEISEITIDLETKAHSRSWAVGAKLGLDANWMLGEGFYVLGNVGGALAYQHFKVDANIIEIISSVKDKVGYVVPSVEAMLGLGWGTYFDHHNWHFFLTAGYEFQLFFNQNMMRNLVDRFLETIDSGAGIADSDAGNLMFHGLTVTAGLDF